MAKWKGGIGPYYKELGVEVVHAAGMNTYHSYLPRTGAHLISPFVVRQRK